MFRYLFYTCSPRFGVTPEGGSTSVSFRFEEDDEVWRGEIRNSLFWPLDNAHALSAEVLVQSCIKVLFR